MDCNCYVGRLGDEALFTLHYGAHNPSCPVYRVSLDPVDQTNDVDELIAALRRGRRGNEWR